MNRFKKIKDNFETGRVGSFIKKLRKSHGLSQDDLAEELFVSRQTVSKWERGESLPSPDALGMLGKKFGITFEEFYAGERQPLDETKDLATILFQNPLFNIIFFVILITIIVYLPLDKRNSYDLTFNSDILNIEKAKIFVKYGTLNIKMNNVYETKSKKKYVLTFYTDKDNILYSCTYYDGECKKSFYREDLPNNFLKRNKNKLRLSIVDSNNNNNNNKVLLDNKVNLTQREYYRFREKPTTFTSPKIRKSEDNKTLELLDTNKSSSKDYIYLSDDFFNRYYDCINNKYFLKNHLYKTIDNAIVISNSKNKIYIDSKAIEFYIDGKSRHIINKNGNYIFTFDDITFYNMLMKNLIKINKLCY